MQDAFATALVRWPRDGVPRSPGAWIVATARNGAIDRIRRERTFARKAELLARLEAIPVGGGRRRELDPRRAPRAALHVLPPGARSRGPHRPHAPRGGWPRDTRDRARVPRRGDSPGPAARPGQAAAAGDGDPLPRAARPPAAGPGSRRATRPLPRLQRGVCRDRRRGARPSRALRGGDPARQAPLRPDAGRARGVRAPRLAAPSGCAARRTGRPGRRARPAGRPGSRALGRPLDRGGPPRPAARGRAAPAGPVPAPGGRSRRGTPREPGPR